MALMFLAMPTSDSERLRMVEWLGRNGLSCYLRSRQVDALTAATQSGIAMTILVNEEHLQEAKRILAEMPEQSTE